MLDAQNKIAFTWQSRSVTGAQHRFLKIAQALNARGQHAVVLLEEGDANAVASVLGELPSYIVSFKLPSWIKALTRGRSRAPRLWWYSGLRTVYFFALKRELQKLSRTQGICHFHVSMSSDYAHCAPGKKVFEITSPDWVDKLHSRPEIIPDDIILHAVSESVGVRLRSLLPERRIVVAPELFPNMDKANVSLRKMESKENIIIFAHRLIPRKNGVIFAKAARRFLAGHPDWRVLIRGEGPDENEIKKILLHEIKNGQVSVGYVADLPSELRRSRIFVSLIVPDNYPSQSVVEAMICGNALLLSDSGLSREKFFDKNGILTSINEDNIVENLNYLISNSESLSEMCAKSAFLAERRFSQIAYLRHLFQLYSESGFSVNAAALEQIEQQVSTRRDILLRSSV